MMRNLNRYPSMVKVPHPNNASGNFLGMQRTMFVSLSICLFLRLSVELFKLDNHNHRMTINNRSSLSTSEGVLETSNNLEVIRCAGRLFILRWLKFKTIETGTIWIFASRSFEQLILRALSN